MVAILSHGARVGALLFSASVLLGACRKEDPIAPDPLPDTEQPVLPIPGRDDNMALGNPSAAITSVLTPENYLMVKPQYALAYQNSRGTARWVSWHLSTSWKGNAERCDCFSGDDALPFGFFQAVTQDYTNTGFNRGHLCPSDDRDGSDADNEVTFLMTNVMPQAPILNQVTWGNLEDYARSLIYDGYEVYTVAGGYGAGGTGSNGGTTTTIAFGNITVPSRYWKVLVVLEEGEDDINRISSNTRVIAVDMPNTQTVNASPWGAYRTTVDAIEDSTGLDLLSLVPAAIQSALESAVDDGPTQ